MPGNVAIFHTAQKYPRFSASWVLWDEKADSSLYYDDLSEKDQEHCNRVRQGHRILKRQP